MNKISNITLEHSLDAAARRKFARMDAEMDKVGTEHMGKLEI